MEVLSPEQVRKRRESKKEEVSQENKNQNKYVLKADCTTVKYESEGRFDAPEELSFHDFDLEDINNITLSRREDLLENIIVILNKCLIKDQVSTNFSCDNFTLEEFMETLVAIKKSFEGRKHIHRWICECQSSVDEKSQIVNETEIDLESLNFISLTECDESIRNYSKEEFESMDREEWLSYLDTRYAKNPLENRDTWTIEDELKTITIKEPITANISGHTYSFRFTRVGDMIAAQKYAYKKYAAKIGQVQKRQEHNVPLAELKERKKTEIESLEYERDKMIILFSRAMSLLKYDGKELTDVEKYEVFSKLPRSTAMEIMKFLEQVKFGIQDEREFVCPICGESSKRDLQHDINPIELLPLDSSSNRNKGERPRVHLYFGA